MDNYKEYLINKLKGFTRDKIIISSHALLRLNQRQIREEEIIENLINPKRLEYAVKQEAKSKSEEKFDCYFGYTKSLCHRYVIIIKNNIVVVTVVKINRKWQKIAEKKSKGKLPRYQNV